jgi:hypothetical protein
VAGLLLPAFCDSHVHLGLTNPDALVTGGIGRVVDLGWDPAIAATWLQPGFANLVVDVAGPLLAAPGGYPLKSGWAPDAAVREIGDSGAAAAAMDELRRLGARVAKITLNSDAGPVWDDDILRDVVVLAHKRGLSVVAHAQGTGQAERAFVAGVDCLAHTPWTEVLSDDVIRRMIPGVAWISTLDIHGWGTYGADFTRASGNLERFAAWGGTVHYGTDLGNGPLPIGLNRRELVALADAGLDMVSIVESLRGLLPADRDSRLASSIPDAANVDDLGTIDDLMRAVVVALPAAGEK